MPIFSQNGQLLFFWSKLRGISQLHAIFDSNIVEGLAESCVEVEISIDGAGWRWMELGGGGCMV